MSTEGPNPIALVEELFSKIIGPFTGTGVTPLLNEPDQIDDRVNLLLKTFDEHSALITPFRKLIKSLHAQEVDVPLEEQIRFFNTDQTRTWLMVNLFNQVLNLKELKLNEDTGRLPGRPEDMLKFAYQARAALGEEGRYKDYSYAAGLFFDFLFHVQRTAAINSVTKYDEPMAQAFIKACEQAKLIMHLARHKPKLSLEKLSAIAPFFRLAAQLSLYILRPTVAPEFYKKLAGMKLNEQMRMDLEMKTFGIHIGMISAYIAQSIPMFEPLGECMSVWGFPYLSWVKGRKDIHDLTAICELGVVINERALKSPDFPSPGVAGITLPELKNLEFNLSAEVKSEIKI